MTPRVTLVVLAATLTLTAAILLDRRRDARDGIAALESRRSALADSSAIAALEEEVDGIRFQLERARALPERSAEPHLALTVGGPTLTLERAGIVLRSAPVAGEVARGIRTVERLEAGQVALSGGVVLRPVRAPADSAGAGAGTLWLGARDFDAIRGALRRGTIAYLH